MTRPPIMLAVSRWLSKVTDGQARAAFALALATVGLLAYVEAVGSPGAVVRKYLTTVEAPIHLPGGLDGQMRQPLQVPARQTVAIDRRPLDQVIDDTTAALAALNTSLESVTTAARSKLGIDLTADPRETLRKNPTLDRVIRQQPTGRESWNRLLASTQTARASTANAQAVLRSSGSRSLEFERVEDFETLVNTMKDAAGRLIAGNAALAENQKDVEHLAVLITADRFEQKLNH